MEKKNQFLRNANLINQLLLAGFLNSLNLNLLVSKVKSLNNIYLKEISYKALPLFESKHFFFIY